MEWAQLQKDEHGKPKVDPDGLWLKGEVVRVDVMRREAGHSGRYGADRAGEWEFASYLTDGTFKVPAAETVSCAKCHTTATAERDFVFQARFPALKAE